MISPAAMKPVKEVNGKAIPKRRDGWYVRDDGFAAVRVTTFLKIIDKSGALIRWATSAVFDALVENPELLGNRKEALGAPDRRRDAAANLGKTIHSWAEALKQGAKIDPTSLPEDLRGYGQAFLNWTQTEQPVLKAAELTVYSEQYGFAGTTDMLAEIQGHLALVDIKTGKGLYPEFSLQLECYKVAYNESMLKHDLLAACVEDTWLLHLQPDGNYVFKKVNGDFEAAMAAKKLWEWQQKISKGGV